VTRGSLVLAGVLVGLLAGIVAAFAIPRTGADATAGRRAQQQPIGPTTVRRVGAPLAFHADVQLRLHGRPRIEARAKDPLGGPDWVVRVFGADRVVRPGIRRPGVNPVIGKDLCAQLGRLHQGHFGWLDAAGTFRPVHPQIGGSEAWWCGSRRPDLGGHPHFATLSTITDPSRSVARVKSTVVWGVAGRQAGDVELSLAGRSVSTGRTPHNAFLVIADGALRQTDVHGLIRYAGHRTVREPEQAAMTLPPGRALSARAPDPNGGLPFGLVTTRAADGGWCTETGSRVVGDRAGGVDYLLDVLTELRAYGGGSCAGGHDTARLFRDHPVVLSWGGGSGPRAEEGADPGGTGRVARRTQPGTTVFSGRAAPDVVAVTLETPRDVRTLIPSGPAHAVIAVYDGSFPTGVVRVTARFRNGRTHTETLPDVSF
jgi:hypothetical protein